MGIALLWIESLAVSLLLVATATACLAQLGPRQTRWFGRACAATLICVGTLIVLALIFRGCPYGPLWITFVAACTAGASWGLLRRPWLGVVGVMIALMPLAMYAVSVALLAFELQLEAVATGGRFFVFILLAAVYTFGAAFLLDKGLRRPSESESPRAATWPRGRLAVALLVVLALHLMTLWNLDLAARQQLSAMRTEAGALALSVAPTRLPNSENAANTYLRAFEALGRSAEWLPGWHWEKSWDDAWKDRWTKWQEAEKIDMDLQDPELRRFLKRHASTLALFRQAAAKPGCTFDRDYGRPSIAMLLPEVEPLRNGARLLSLDAICHAADKDYRGAMDDIGAMFNMAEHLRAEPLGVSQLVANSIDTCTVDTLRHVLALGPVPADDVATLQVASSVPYRARLQQTLRMEEAFRLVTFGQVAEGQIDLKSIVSIDSVRNEYRISILNASALAPIYRLLLLSEDVAAQARFSAQIDLAIGRSYDQAKTELHQLETDLLREPGGILTSLFMVAFEDLLMQMARGEAQRNTARLGLALYVYHARKGTFPGTLDELVPEFIPVIPVDPFDGQPLKLKVAGKRATVYSIGPDMTDDGGTPMNRAERKGDITFAVP